MIFRKVTKLNFFFLHFYTHAFCWRSLSLHTHRKLIHYTYPSKANDPRKKTRVAKGWFDATAPSYKCLKIKQLAKTTIFASHDRTHFVQDVYILAHTKCIYTTYHSEAYDPRQKTLGAKDRSDVSARSYKWVQVFKDQATYENDQFCLARRILFKMFISPHTHKKHIHFIYHLKVCNPRKMTWVAKSRSDASARYYKCLKLKYLWKRRALPYATELKYFVQDVYLRTHTKSMYTIYTIWKPMIQVRKRE